MNSLELEEYIRAGLNGMDKDELAFIQLTGKEERLIRDKTAYAILKNENKNWNEEKQNVRDEKDILKVKREHKYIDIATFLDEQYADLIEFSLFYTWDLLLDKMYMNKNGIKTKLTKDKMKLETFPAQSNKFIVLCILHPRRDQQLKPFEKANLFSYPQFFDTFLSNKYDDLPLIGFERIKKDFSKDIPDDMIRSFKMDFGVYLKARLSIYFWIIPVMQTFREDDETAERTNRCER